MPAIGNAAARETLVTATGHVAAIWTDLFKSLLARTSELRWLGEGPGIGRDARIAYSSLFGRYLARAYLTEFERVHLLVPLDVAMRRLQGTGYAIQRLPSSRGLQADWIGFDDSGLVIVEAKGTFDKTKKAWRGPWSAPEIMRTAINQARRTRIVRLRPYCNLPATRWAIASRWATQGNLREPTLLAWPVCGSKDDRLEEDDYERLAKALVRADHDAVISGLGHQLEFEEAMDRGSEGAYRAPEELRINIGDHPIEFGYSAMIGPAGIIPLRSERDLRHIDRAREFSYSFAVASLSYRYVRTVSQRPTWIDETHTTDRSSRRAGLTVAWLIV